MSWQVDYGHSHIMLSARHLMVSIVRGQFDKFKVNAEIDEQDVTNSKVEVLIEAASVNTKNEQRDAHMRSADFLNVEKYPIITFKSKQMQHIDSHHGRLVGDLTLRDVTREVVLDVEFLGQAKAPWGTISAGFSAKTKVSRKDWGVSWNLALETGGWLMSDEVTIEIEVEFTKQPEPAKEAPKTGA